MAKLEGYQVSVANTILSPGKFEGEHVSTLVFYDHYMNGGHSYEDGDSIVFELTEEERKHLGNNSPLYVLRVTDDGFVYGNV